MPQISEIKLLKSNFENVAIYEELKEECLQLKRIFKQKIELRQKLELEHIALQQSYKDLSDQLNQEQTAPDFDLQGHKEDLEEKLEIDGDKFTEDGAEKLEKHSYLLGYRVTNLEPIDINTQLVTLHYNNNLLVQFKTGERLDLQRIYPNHPNFDAIKTMLYETNDISGLLAILRKFSNKNPI